MVSKPFDEGVSADNRGVGDAVRGSEVLAFSLPGKISGA